MTVQRDTYIRPLPHVNFLRCACCGEQRQLTVHRDPLARRTVIQCAACGQATFHMDAERTA